MESASSCLSASLGRPLLAEVAGTGGGGGAAEHRRGAGPSSPSSSLLESPLPQRFESDSSSLASEEVEVVVESNLGAPLLAELRGALRRWPGCRTMLGGPRSTSSP